jgi:hypothetical protein
LKHLISVSIVFLMISCGGNSLAVKANVNKKEIQEGMVASKSIPLRIPGFRYSKKADAFFRNDVSKDVQKRTTQTITKGQKLGNKSGRLKTKPSPKDLKDPYWADYFGEKTISGKIQFDIRVGKNGKADIIVIKKGISTESNTIAAKYISESTFFPGIHAKKSIPVRSWLSLNKSYN